MATLQSWLATLEFEILNIPVLEVYPCYRVPTQEFTPLQGAHIRIQSFSRTTYPGMPEVSRVCGWIFYALTRGELLMAVLEKHIFYKKQEV